MKISQEDAILIKNLYLSKQYGARRLLSELPDKSWKLGSIDSLLKRIRKTGTIRQPGSGRPRSVGSSGGLIRRTSQKGIVQLVRFRVKLPFSSVHRIIHCDLQLKSFKRRRAQLLSEANGISRIKP